MRYIKIFILHALQLFFYFRPKNEFTNLANVSHKSYYKKWKWSLFFYMHEICFVVSAVIRKYVLSFLRLYLCRLPCIHLSVALKMLQSCLWLHWFENAKQLKNDIQILALVWQFFNLQTSNTRIVVLKSHQLAKQTIIFKENLFEIWFFGNTPLKFV